MRLQAGLHGIRSDEARRRGDELLDRVGLADAADRRVGGYSGGMKRRLDLALALVHRPIVLFLDEPTTGLDIQSRHALWDEVARLSRDDGVTVFLTTQYLEEADRLADRIAVLDGGRVVADGTSAQLKEQVAGHRLDLVLADAAAFEEVARRLDGRAAQRDPARLTIGVATDGSAAQVRALLDEVDPARRVVDRFAVHSATLDDVFLALTGHPADRPESQDENDNEHEKEPASV
jgi:ABC-2 type transport system ATP-binding protein